MFAPWDQACVLLVFVGLVVLLWACFALLGRGKPKPGEGDELHELNVTAERVKRLVKADLLDERAGSAVLRAVARRRWHLLRLDPVPRREPPPQEFDETPVALPVEDELPVLEPVKVVAKPPRRARPNLTPPTAPTPPVPAEPVPPPTPPRRWTDVLTGFMEEKNILWGELVGGLLVVGCSVALVISLWRTLSVIPYFPFAVFSAISLALFGVGQYTLHHWKLESTSRALLVITSLLLPLNLLVLAGLARGNEGGGVEIVVSLAALAVFTFVAHRAGREVGGGWTFPLAVVGTAAPPLLLPWVSSSAGPWLPAALAGLAVGCFAGAVAARLITLPTEGTLRPQVLRLFLFVGIACFACGVTIAFLATQVSDPVWATHGLAGPLSLAGVPLLLAGLVLQRRLNGAEEGALRTVATSVALLGLVVMLVAVVLAWTMPGMLLAICLLNAVVLTGFAFRLSVPLVHTVAVTCLALGTLTAYQLLAGRLSAEIMAADDVLFRMLTGDGGLVLAGLAIALAVVAELLARSGRYEHAVAQAIGGFGVGVAALLLIGLVGIAHPERAALVFLSLGGATLAFNLRWELRWLAMLGYCLLLAGSVWLLAWLDPGPTSLWGLVLAVETLALAGLAAWRSRDPERSSVLTAPCHELAPFAGGLALLLAVLARDFPGGWPHTLTALVLASASLLLGWVVRSPVGAWFAAGLLWAGLTHLFTIVVPVGTVATPWTVALLATSTLLLAARVWLSRPRFSQQTHELFAIPAGHAAIGFSGFALLAIALSPEQALLTVGLHLAWLGALWLATAWVERSAEWMTGTQVVLAVAAVVLSLALGQGHGWLDGVRDPRAWQLGGVALAALGIAWVVARRILRGSETARILFAPPWPSVEAILLALLPMLSLVLAVTGCWPALARELFNVALPAADLRFLGVGTWLFVGSLFALLAASLWDRNRDLALPGLVVLGLSLPFTIATAFDSGLTGATALRGAMAATLVVLSLPFWLRPTLAGYPSPLPPLRGGEGEQRFTPLRLGEGPGEGSSRPISGLPPFDSWSVRLARGLLLGGGVGVVVAVGVTAAVVSPLATAISVAVPLGLASLALVGHALRQRSSVLLFVAGQVVTLAAVLVAWQLSMSLPAGLRWVPVAQAGLIASAVVALLWLAFQRRFASDWPPSLVESSLLAIQTGLAGVGTLLLLTLPLCWMFVDPRQALPVALRSIADAGGWLTWTASFVAVLTFCRRWRPAMVPHVLGFAGLGLSVLAALLADRLLPAGGSAWLVLLASWSLLGVVWTGALAVNVRASRDAMPARLWVEALVTALVLLGLRSCNAATALPWSSAGPVVVAAVLLGAVAVLIRASSHVWLSGLYLVMAAVLVWLEWGRGPIDEAVLLLASSLAVAGLFWGPLARWFDVRTRFPHVAALSGLGVLGLVAVVDWLLPSAGPASLAWVSLGLVALALVAQLWDEQARMSLVGLYIVGLVGIVLLIDSFGLHGDQATALGSLALSAQVLAATFVCRLSRRLGAFADSLGLASWVSRGKVRDWWIAAQAVLAALVVLLGARLSLTSSHWLDRLAGAGSALVVLLAAVSFVSLLTGRRQQVARLASMALAPVVLVALGSILLEPLGSAGPLHHAALAFTALVLCAIACRNALPRLLPDTPWALDARRAGAWLGIAALPVLAVLLLTEMRTYDLVTKSTPLTVVEVIHVALALLALLVLSLREALRPTAEGVPGRTGFVYAAEALLVLLFVHLRWNIPAMREVTAVRYWPFLIMGVAYAGAALGEWFRRRGLEVLAGPLHRTGLLLPVLPLLAFWLRPTPEMLDAAGGIAPGLKVLLSPLMHLPEHHAGQAILWGATALLLLGIAIARRSFAYSLAAALTANVALWMLLTHHGLGLFLHPQLWLIPLGLIVLVSVQVNRDHLSPEQRRALRYVGLLLLYLSSTADLFLNGIGTSVVLPLALALLSVLGVLAGLLLRVRAFLFLGVLFLLIDVLSMIWHAAVDRSQTWVWYVSGIVLGGAILALFAVFEKRRDDMLRLVEGIRKWD